MAGKTGSKIGRYLLVALLAIAVLIASVGLGVLPLNLFFAKSAISKAVMETLGAELIIHGPVRIRFGFKPVLSASEITLSAAGRTGRPLLQIDSLAIRPGLLDVMRGNMHLRNLEATGIAFDYCPVRISIPEAEPGEGSLPSIAVDRLRLTGIRPHCAQAGRELAFLPAEFDLTASAPRDGQLSMEIEGRDGPEIMTLTAVGASLTSLLSDPPAYPLTLELGAFGSELRVDGIVNRPLSAPGLNVEIDLVSEHPMALWAAAGIEVPAPGALKIKAQALASADEIRLDSLEATLGEQQLSLSGLARGFLSRPYFEFDAQLAQLDLELFTSGLDEGAGESDQETAGFQAVFDLLAQFDARARVSIDRLLNPVFPIDGLVLDTRLDNGLLSLNHAELLLAGSPVAAQATLDLRPDCPQLTSNIQISDADLALLGQFMDADSAIGGQLKQAALSSSSCGTTLDEHIRSLHLDTALSGMRPRFGDVALPLVVNTLDAGVAWNEPGRLSADGLVLGEAVSAEISFGSVDALLTAATWPLTITASGPGSRLDLSGNAALSGGTINLDAGLDLSVGRFGTLHAWIGADPANQLALSVRTQLKYRDKGLDLDGIDASLGQSNLRGSVSWKGPESELPATIHMQSDRLVAHELVSLFAEEPGQIPKEDPQARSGLQPETEWIDQWFKLPSVDIDLALAQFDGIDFDVSQVKLHGRLRDRLIEDGRLELLFEDIDLTGALEADFRQKPWNVSYELGVGNIDIGRLLASLNIADNVDAQADRLDFHYVSEGRSIRDLAVNSRLQTTIASLHWIAEPVTGNRSYDFHLSGLELTATPQSPISWQSSGFLNGTPIRAWMQSPSLPVTFDTNEDLPLTLVFSIGEEVLMLQSIIDRKVTNGGRTELTISGQHMDTAGVDFSELEAPLGDYEFSSSLTFNDAELLFSGLEARVGTSRASGHVNIRQEDTRHHFDILLHSPFLETEDLVDWVETWRTNRIQTPDKNTVKSVSGTAEGRLFAMINQQIEDLTEQNDFEIRIDIEELRSTGIPLGKAQLGLHMDEHEFRLEPFQIALPGGVVDAEYFGRYMEQGVDTELNIRIKRLEYGGLLRLLDPESEARGHAYLDTSLVSRAPDASQLVNRLEGHFKLLIIPEDIGAGFLDLWASNLVFALLPAGSDSRKKLNCLVASFDVENGVMKGKNTLLDSTEVIVRGRGTIDLANRELDLLFAPQSKREKFLSVSTPIEVTGPFNDYQIGATSGGFLMTLFRWYMGIIYVPYKRLTGERFPADGLATCFDAVDWDLPAAEQDHP
jgi:uncharacterized protein involved in outer membrane biogenesis